MSYHRASRRVYESHYVIAGKDPGNHPARERWKGSNYFISLQGSECRVPDIPGENVDTSRGSQGNRSISPMMEIPH
ncbi:hypothetical protein CEXT_336151 [Caerostris extrusa]|uniref:Uncharacterized protein n=1 Tax=Caerostris extrusa TaxID=172846 RepID=A0AAV4S669_CAEEX|nr:hypothetical protein CEXT_336151 [Caerostris extrusa]